MRIHDYIQQHIFARRAAERGCLVIYDPARRYRDLALALAGPNCVVLDAGASLIEQREAAMNALRNLSAGSVHQLIVWAPLAKPETDDQAQRDPFSVLARVGAVFPRGDDDEYASLCRSAKPDHLTELEKLFAEGEPSIATVDALDEGGTWPQLKAMLQAASAKEILLGLPTLQVLALAHVAMINSDRKFRENDVVDFEHVSQAVPYCDAFFCDNPIKNLLCSKPLELDARFGVTVLSGPGEILNFLMRGRDSSG